VEAHNEKDSRSESKELEDLLTEDLAEPEVPTEPEEPEEPEEVEALTEREMALMSHLTASDLAEQDQFDPSVPPAQSWATEEYQFIKEGESIDDILADAAKFNAKMAQLYNDALRRGAQLGLEATYRSMPRTISVFARQQIDVVNTVNDFYQHNKDLIPLKPAMARIAQKVGTEHPEYTLSQLLTESAKSAREIFKLQKVKQLPPKELRSNSPAFVQQKGGNNRIANRKSDGPKSLEEEVMDLIS
jgi:hypothetical protein